MFHSVPVSEPIAFIAGLLMGVLGYFLAHLVQLNPTHCLLVGNIFAVSTSVLVGGKINLVLLDVLGFLVFRPLTGMGTHWAINHWLS